MSSSIRPLNISEIIGKIKGLLEGEFRQVTIEGEITNLALSTGGHWYFSLSDPNASISAALFKMDAFRNPVIKKIRDGDKVVCHGSIGVYAKRGTFQIIVKQIFPAGKGDLKEQFERLKRKLAGEGLFDLDRKKVIPALPNRVVVITALRGAALHDFLDIFKRRGWWMDVLVVPAAVQGESAPGSLVGALSRVIEYSRKAKVNEKIDVVVFTRGGGGLEDLWAFNDEKLAREIFACPIPVVSAIGHQVDYVISDFVADLRCETPSAAAEVLTDKQTKLKEALNNAGRHLLKSGNYKIKSLKHVLESYNPQITINGISARFYRFQKRLNRCDISRRLPEFTKIHERNMRLDDLFSRMNGSLEGRVRDWGQRLRRLDSMLRVLNPQNVLGRGYTFLTGPDDQVVGTLGKFKKLPGGEKLTIHFHDGRGQVVKQD